MRMEVILSPQNPSYVDIFMVASIKATNDEGRLAPLTTSVNISLELPQAYPGTAELLGNVTVDSEYGVATFSGAVVKI